MSWDLPALLAQCLGTLVGSLHPVSSRGKREHAELEGGFGAALGGAHPTPAHLALVRSQIPSLPPSPKVVGLENAQRHW